MPHASFDDNLKWFFSRPAQDGSLMPAESVLAIETFSMRKWRTGFGLNRTYVQVHALCIMAGPNIHWGSGSTPHTNLDVRPEVRTRASTVVNTFGLTMLTTTLVIPSDSESDFIYFLLHFAGCRHTAQDPPHSSLPHHQLLYH